MAASNSPAEKLITENLDIWTSAIKKRGSQGRGSSKKIELYGIKKLRELILELAVRGLLVPQDPNDEPASVLLEKIAAEKEQLIKDGKIKKQKALPEISEDEKPFVLPNGWGFSRFSDVLDFSGGSQPPKSTFSDSPLDDYVQLIQIRDLGPSPQPVFVPKDLVSKFCTPNDVMVGRYGASVGKVFWGKDGAYNVALIKMHNEFNVYSQAFLHLIMLSPVGQSFFTGMSRSAQAGFSKADIAGKILPIPPQKEQPRIVAKVDELMALCDQLEQQTESSLSAHQTLVETLLNTLLNADQNSFDQTWKRIAQHFDVLFTTEHSIDQLKQTFLQLAVMGKLVPQDPNDEPASVLLEKIAAEKEQLIKDKVIKKQKPLPPISEDDKPFELPKGWEFARLGDLTTRIGSGSTPRGGQSAYEDSGIIFLRSQNVWNDGLRLNDTAYISEETHQKMSNTHVYPGDVLLNITGASLGRSIIFPKELVEANVSQHVTIIRLIEQNMGSFVHMGILSPLVQRLVWGRQVGMAIEGLSKKVLELFEFPVPPLAEQTRIIEKVSQFMDICDSLKLQIQQSNITQIHIADAIADSALGRTTIIRLEEKEEKKIMIISTELSLGSVEYDKSAILAPLIGDDGADAKIVWSKSKLELPLFYNQLKLEIKAGFVAKPAKAEFEG